jgi:hypothetical protein
VLAGLPHVEDPEHAGVVVESRRVCDQPLERPVADLVRHEVEVRRRAIGDGELLDVDNCHVSLLRGLFDHMTPEDADQRRGYARCPCRVSPPSIRSSVPAR